MAGKILRRKGYVRHKESWPVLTDMGNFMKTMTVSANLRRRATGRLSVGVSASCTTAADRPKATVQEVKRKRKGKIILFKSKYKPKSLHKMRLLPEEKARKVRDTLKQLQHDNNNNQSSSPAFDHGELTWDVCPYCRIKFNSDAEFRRHLSQIHTGDKFYTCTVCGERLPGYYSLFSLEQHMLAHKQACKACPICRKSFVYERSLRNHQSVHVGCAAPGLRENSTYEADLTKLSQRNCPTSEKEPQAEEGTLPRSAKDIFLSNFGLVRTTPERVTRSKAWQDGFRYAISEEHEFVEEKQLSANNAWSLEYFSTPPDNSCSEEDTIPAAKSCQVMLTDLGNYTDNNVFTCSACHSTFLQAPLLHAHIVDKMCSQRKS